MSSPKEDTTTVKQYFTLTKEYQQKYGDTVVLLMQVGSFIEIYGLKDEKTHETHGSIIEKIASVCNLNISEKKICVGKDQVLMAGFRDYSVEKYIQKIIEAGYTAVVYLQEDDDDLSGSKSGIKKEKKKRYLEGVYSPGTYMSYETENTQKITNNIMCIWFETMKTRTKQDRMICGVSVANTFTGKSYLFEYECPFYINPTTFDELERSVSVFAPSEVIILSPFDKKVLQNIVQYCGIQTNIHYVNNQDQENKKVQNCGKQKYIQEILKKFYGEEAHNICYEFYNYTMSTQSFCYLLDFIQEHNPDMVKKMSIPEFNNTSDRLVLGNHTLKQLNIIDEQGKKYGNLSSVSSLLNKCVTTGGKRLFLHQIVNPTSNENWLKMEYAMTQKMLDNYDNIGLIRKQLSSVRDIEKICRQIVMKKIYPDSIYHLYQSSLIISQINTLQLFTENPDICDYLTNEFIQGSPQSNKTVNSCEIIQTNINSIIGFLESKLEIQECKSQNSLEEFQTNIIKTGVSKKLDDLIQTQIKNNQVLQSIQDFFNNLMRTTEKTSNKGIEYVVIHKREKLGVTLQLTKKRASTLKQLLLNQKEIRIQGYTILASEIKFSGASGSNEEIHFELLNNVTNQVDILEKDVNKEILIVFMEVLSHLENTLLKNIENLGKYVAKLDVLQSKAYIARTYKYCCPEIIEKESIDSTGSFVRASQLRHCLIEHIQQNETYVANDISIGCDGQNGILLYGTNAVGKTSLIRALGIAVIMAQCGLFVPCSQFQYVPYTAIYSRILGNDNLFKGLSTFAVEISELRVILNMADNRSLVLGDEICSGTETESALSIFVKSLMVLHEKETSFIFATHFHEILKYDEVKVLTRMALKHMAVHYDRELDCLVYDRILQPGSGNRTYGLEVCKSLYLNEDFLSGAYELRNKYFPESRGELSNKTTIYNAKKIRGMCEICNEELADEIHHINEQHLADENGFIGTFHKNHPANLMGLCEKCHDSIHYSNDTEVNKQKIVRKKTTKGYVKMI